MRFTVLLLALASAFTFAADNAAVAPQSATSHKSQATTYGAESITIPQMLSYQGKLTDTLGQPVPNGNYALTFRLYTQLTGGSAIWTEAQTITVKSGLFSALLGAVTPIGSLPDAGALYLSLQVAADPELSPRLRIASAAYAYLTERAANSDLLQGKDTAALDSRYVNEGQASSVSSNMIVDGTIAAVDLNQMGASSGQVMKWTGSAWVPRNDSVGQSSGGTVTSVSQATGIKCTPNPITTTGAVGLDTTYSDGRYIQNQFASNQVASWRIAGQGRCSTAAAGGALLGRNSGSNSYGVWGIGTVAYGVLGQNASTTSGAVGGINYASAYGGSGVYGYGAACYGVEGSSIDNYGVYGHSTNSDGVVGSSVYDYGVMGVSSNSFGVYGHGWNSNGVYGMAGAYPGVRGDDTSTTSAAVEGHNYATSAGGCGVAGFGSAAIGVYGNSSNSYGVQGTSANNFGVRGQSTSSNGVVGYGDTTTTQGYGVYARARNSAVYGKSDYFKGVYGEALDDDGVYGYAHGTTLYHYAGVHGYAGSDSTYGVRGEATVHPGVYGTNSSTHYAAIEGHNTTTSVGSAAVAGFGDTVNVAAYGVYGLARYHGVYGRSKYYNGVRGEALDDNGVSGYYSGTTTSYAGVWGGRGSYGYGVYYSGGLQGSGSKNCVMRTSRGPTALYCQESPENWFEDFGSGTLANGHSHIDLDALFLETVTVDQNHGIKVFLQQTSGDPVNLVVQKGTTGFDVKGPAGSSISFDYRVVAKRKGFEDVRLDVVRAGYNDPYLYPDPNDPQIPAPIRAKRIEAARLAALNNGAGPQPRPSNPTTIRKPAPTGSTPATVAPGK
jgi:hypothetical protein